MKRRRTRMKTGAQQEQALRDRRAADEALDAALDQSFPASDPPSMTEPGPDPDPTRND